MSWLNRNCFVSIFHDKIISAPESLEINFPSASWVEMMVPLRRGIYE